MSEYRDYGTIGGIGQTDVPVDITRYGQVYQATHVGNQRSDYMWRSFISFTYGGKHIEDFNLIAYTNGDRLNRSGSAAFNDITTTYDNLTGQQYWNTHYQANTLEVNLETDGIDQRMLDDFLHWFRAGEAKELILAEHPNRAILARVAEPPQLSLLPFESQVAVQISGYSYDTHTTLYKGEIVLKFVMDDPFWYAKDNLLGIKREANGRVTYIDQWEDANGNNISIFMSKDALKILYEDGIPLGSMIQNNMLLGNGSFANVEDNVISRIWSMSEEEENWETEGVGARIEAETQEAAVIPYTKGVIAGAIIDADGNGISSLSKSTPYDSPFDANYGHFFYSGTAPAPTIISFTLTPHIGSDGYIDSPYNSKTTTKYNTITIESQTKQELRFTTPNILTSYNKVIEVFKAYVNSNYTWEDIREHIRDEVRHKAIREWATVVINNQAHAHASGPSIDYLSTMMTNMQYVLKDTTGTMQPMTFTFNSETGEAIGQFKYRTFEIASIAPTWATYGNLTEVEEDVGDMLRSNYIIIRDRNYPTSSGAIVKWTSDNKQYSHCIYHDVDYPLSNLSIIYKNMYL